MLEPAPEPEPEPEPEPAKKKRRPDPCLLPSPGWAFDSSEMPPGWYPGKVLCARLRAVLTVLQVLRIRFYKPMEGRLQWDCTVSHAVPIGIRVCWHGSAKDSVLEPQQEGTQWEHWEGVDTCRMRLDYANHFVY